MCDKTDLLVLCKIRLAWSCCSKRLFCVIHCFIISLCDDVSQFNNGARGLPFKASLPFYKNHHKI